jgi:hypothetical protein
LWRMLFNSRSRQKASFYYHLPVVLRGDVALLRGMVNLKSGDVTPG